MQTIRQTQARSKGDSRNRADAFTPSESWSSASRQILDACLQSASSVLHHPREDFAAARPPRPACRASAPAALAQRAFKRNREVWLNRDSDIIDQLLADLAALGEGDARADVFAAILPAQSPQEHARKSSSADSSPDNILDLPNPSLSLPPADRRPPAQHADAAATTPAIQARLDALQYAHPELSPREVRALYLVTALGVNANKAKDFTGDHASRPAQANMDLGSYCLLRAAGLSDQLIARLKTITPVNLSMIEETRRLQGQRIPRAAPWSQFHPGLRYCALRVLNFTPFHAANWQEAGGFFAVCWARNWLEGLIERFQREAGFKPGVLCFPQFSVTVASEVLGAGKFNQVLGFDWGGKSYAFKPSKTPARTGRSAEICGIAQNRYFPELRNLAAVLVARALGIAGPGGVVGEMAMGLLNNQLGLVMERAPGEESAAFVRNYTVPPGSQLALRLAGFQQQMQDPMLLANQLAVLGLHSLQFDGGAIRITATASRSGCAPASPFQDQDGSLKRAYARVQFFNWLVNDGDGHPKNTFVFRQAGPDGDWVVTRIDLDQCMGKRSVDQSSDEYASMSYFLPPFPVYIDPELKQAIEALNEDDLIEPFRDLRLDDAEVAAFLSRLALARHAIDEGEIQVLYTLEQWHRADMSDSGRHVFGRHARRVDPALLQ